MGKEPRMIANALFIAVALLLVLGFWLMGELKFFIPYKLVLWREYATPILTYVALLSVNVFAAAFIFIRKFFLKDTGRKLPSRQTASHRWDRGACAMV
jgi:hypothetical protein